MDINKIIPAVVGTCSLAVIGWSMLSTTEITRENSKATATLPPAISQVETFDEEAADEAIIDEAHFVKPKKLIELEKRIAKLDEAIAKADALLQEDENLDDEELAEETANELEAGWEIAADSDEIVDDPTIPLNDQIQDFDVVKAEKPSNLPAQGDRVELPLLHGQTAKVEVKSSKVASNGDYSWSGHLEGHGTDYPVVVTYGETSTYAMVTTPEGSYSMESVNGVGWLYKNPSERELTKPGTQDYLDMPGHEGHIH